MHLPREYNLSYYRYSPSVGAAVLFAVLYSIIFVLAVFQWIRYKAWVWITMIIAVASKCNLDYWHLAPLMCQSGSNRLHFPLYIRPTRLRTHPLRTAILSDYPRTRPDGSLLLYPVWPHPLSRRPT